MLEYLRSTLDEPLFVVLA